MKPFAWILGLGLACPLVAGCGKSAAPGGCERPAAEPDAAEEARARRADELLGSGERALGAKRFAEAVEDLEGAVRLRDAPPTRELLRRAHSARLNGLWLLSRREGASGSLEVKGLTEGLLFEGGKVTAVRAAQGGPVAEGDSGSYTLDVSKSPRVIDIRWDKGGGKVAPHLGIYRLEKESLVISWGEPAGEDRPREFDPGRAEVRYYARAERGKG